jgi:hypothetical protein
MLPECAFATHWTQLGNIGGGAVSAEGKRKLFSIAIKGLWAMGDPFPRAWTADKFFDWRDTPPDRSRSD